MPTPTKHWDFWRIPAFMLWLVFFLVGLAPEPVYTALREAGQVLPQRALVNSPSLLTLALVAFLGLFGFHRCRETGHSLFEAQDRAVQLCIVGLVAFFPLDLGALFTAHLNPEIANRWLLYMMGALKFGAWWYLLSIIVRYYVFGMDPVFAEIPSLFPSAHIGAKKHEKPNPAPEPPGQQPVDPPVSIEEPIPNEITPD